MALVGELSQSAGLDLQRRHAVDEPGADEGDADYDDGETNDEHGADGVDHHGDEGDDNDEGGGDHEGDVGIGPALERLKVALISFAVQLQLDLHLPRQELLFAFTGGEGAGEAEEKAAHVLVGESIGYDLTGLGVVIVQALGRPVDAPEEDGGAVAEGGGVLEELHARDAGGGDGGHIGKLRDEVEGERLPPEEPGRFFQLGALFGGVARRDLRVAP